MEKDLERSFLETLARALVSLPFDLKLLLEAVSDPDLDHGARELAAAAVVYIIAPRDGKVEPYLRHSEDVLVLRLALRQILTDGGEGAPAFRDRFAEDLSRLGQELELLDGACGSDLVAWLDSRWPILRKAVYARKKIPMFVDDEEVGTLLYDEGMKFGTNYPISEKSLEGRLKLAQPILDHLQRKWDQDKKKITPH
ncbi:MAG TPA: hypothetical protein VJ801_14500 [Polyangia bacterium]|jgi:hypothetical protein|nr:hypothetical protein [Polyangia bacterium]